MAPRPRPRRKGDEKDRRPKKKVSILDTEKVVYIDYKDVNLLRRFMSERAKMRSRRVTGNDTQQQREVAKAIRVAREMALLPYSVRQVTHRGRGRGRDRDDRPGRGDRGDRPMSAETELGALDVGGELEPGFGGDVAEVMAGEEEQA